MKISRLLGTLVVAGTAVVVALYLALHILRPEFNPVRRFLSEYAVGRFGFLMTANFFAQAAVSLVLAIGLLMNVRRSGPLRAGTVLLALTAALFIVLGIFPADLSESADGSVLSVTSAGAVHQAAGTISFICRILAFWLLSRAYRRDAGWQDIAPIANRLAWTFLALFVAFIIVVRWDLGGLAQRAAIGVSLLWMFLGGQRLRNQPAHPGEQAA